MLRRLHASEEGGIALEASLVLPIFLVFVVGLILCIQIAVVEMAMQAGVSEATKSIAGQLYPVRILVQEAKARYDQSHVANMFNAALDQVQTARNHVTGAEDFADQYAAYIPDALLELVRWEKEKREKTEGMAQDEVNNFYDSQIKPRLLAAFTPIVFAFCDASIVNKSSFKVIDVTLPSMLQGGEAFFGVEAQLVYKLPIPCMSQTIVVKKRAYERAWVGA